MRWFINQEIEPELGKQRTIEKFLFLPLRICNEVRWLEKVTIQQQWTHGNIYKSDPHHWMNVCWVDKNQEN